MNTKKDDRLRFLATLDGLTDAERVNLLEKEEDDEIYSLFILCHDEHGRQSDTFKTLVQMAWSRTPCDLMEPARYDFVSEFPDEMSAAEKTAGWHWCREYDGLLVGPGMGELAHCGCLLPEHPMYKTIPSDESP